METRLSISSQNSCSQGLWLMDMIGKETKAQRQNSALFCKDIYSSMQVTGKMYIGKTLVSFCGATAQIGPRPRHC